MHAHAGLHVRHRHPRPPHHVTVTVDLDRHSHESLVLQKLKPRGQDAPSGIRKKSARTKDLVTPRRWEIRKKSGKNGVR